MAKNTASRIQGAKPLMERVEIMVVARCVKKTENTNSVTSIHKSMKVGEVGMPDREKVKKGVWQCWLPSTEEEYETQCHDCPYYEPGITLEECMTALRTDIIALLKEQEAVEPTLIREGRNKNYNDYVCPRCDNEVVYEQNYCSECGVQFLWEGR